MGALSGEGDRSRLLQLDRLHKGRHVATLCHRRRETVEGDLGLGQLALDLYSKARHVKDLRFRVEECFRREGWSGTDVLAREETDSGCRMVVVTASAPRGTASVARTALDVQGADLLLAAESICRALMQELGATDTS